MPPTRSTKRFGVPACGLRSIFEPAQTSVRVRRRSGRDAAAASLRCATDVEHGSAGPARAAARQNAAVMCALRVSSGVTHCLDVCWQAESSPSGNCSHEGDDGL